MKHNRKTRQRHTGHSDDPTESEDETQASKHWTDYLIEHSVHRKRKDRKTDKDRKGKNTT